MRVHQRRPIIFFAGANETSFLQDGTWSREGDVLIATAEGRTQEYDIEELTETTLIISTSLTEELGDPDTGVSIITMLDIRAVFSR